MSTSNAVGRRIERTRLKTGISQREVARLTGYSAAYISRVESGERSPSIKSVRAIAKALGTTEHYLLTGDTSGTWVFVTRDEVAEGVAHGEGLAGRIAAEAPELQLEGSAA